MTIDTTNNYFCLLKNTMNKVNEHMRHWKITAMYESNKRMVSKIYKNNQVTKKQQM